jgi:uncharacterized protein (TIGR00661 family)
MRTEPTASAETGEIPPSARPKAHRKRRMQVAVISNAHLGTYGCHATELLRYLKSIRPQVLVLNGDIVDIWQFRKNYWPPAHMRVVRYLAGLAAKGVKIHYLTGNHDELLRKFAGLKLGNFRLDNKLVLDLPHGRTWLFHGDVFDVTMRHSRWLAKLGGQGYDLLILLNRFVNHLLAKLGRPRVALSHQSAVLHAAAPRPDKEDHAGRAVLKYYAPSTAQYGFHFQAYAPEIATSVIRRQVRELSPVNEGHYTVYLPAYEEALLVERLQYLSRRTRWEVFSKHRRVPAEYGNVRVWPVSGPAFLDSLDRSAGVLCGAGFETPAEALYLGKKLLVMPMKQQYEQQCNAAALAKMGVPVIKSLKDKNLDKVDQWLHRDETVAVDYPDQTGEVLDKLLREQLPGSGSEAKVVASMLHKKERHAERSEASLPQLHTNPLS